MRGALAMLAGLWTARMLRRMKHLRRLGLQEEARQLYRRASWSMGAAVWCAMLLQEGILWRSGLLSWQSGLPLHLCSMTGILTLPMLLSGNDTLWHSALLAGLPGAALALIFPAPPSTPWPGWMALGFYGLHALLICAPLLPLGMGRRIAVQGAAQAWLFWVTAALGISIINRLLSSNYLFLSHPVEGTPLVRLARQGETAYRAWLFGLFTLWMAAQGCLCMLCSRMRQRKKRKNDS